MVVRFPGTGEKGFPVNGDQMKKRKRKIPKALIPASLAFIVFILAFACNGKSGNLRNRKELLNYKNSEASLVLSEEGQLLGKFYSENRTNITLDQLPRFLIEALISTEDVRFYQHRGYDARSFLRVLVKSILLNDRSSGGGSTITQQLAKNMFGRREKGIFHTVGNKINEVIMARRIEKTFTKDEILILYLNTVSFGENVFGVEAASQRFFNKSVSGLKAEEAAVLVGMLKANTWYNPRLNPGNALSRRNTVFSQMEKYNYLSSALADSLSGLPLRIDYNRSATVASADYFMVQVRNETEDIMEEIKAETGKEWDPESDGLVISTTMNLSLQKYAAASFRDHMPKMQDRLNEQYRTRTGSEALRQILDREISRLRLQERAGRMKVQELFDWNGTRIDSISVSDSLRHSLTLLHAGMLAMDPSTGAVKAWIGGIDFKTQPYDQILARKQLASVFKPVLYAAALEDGWEPCQYLDNDSVTLSDFDDWSPENYDHSYGGKYSLAGALAQSMNIPTFSLFLALGFEKVDLMWQRMGFTFPLVNTPSLALGTAEANIREVAVAYSAFANGGYLADPFCVTSVKAPDGTVLWERDIKVAMQSGRTPVISERTVVLMNAMLQKAIAEGTGAPLRTQYGVTFPVAGKTGTSQDYSDAWFAAYNPGLVIVARAGASSRAIHFNSGSYGSGSALALPLVALTLRRVQNDPVLREKFAGEFAPLPTELADALDCPDFREKNFFDSIIDIFDGDEKEYYKTREKVDRGLKNVLRKILRKRRYER